MSQDESGFVTIGSIVDEYLAERQEGSGFFAGYLACAKSGVRELSLYGGSQTIKTATILRNSNTSSSSLPADCVKVLVAAICFPNGKHLLLGYDPTICQPEDEEASSFCPSDAPNEADRFDQDCGMVSSGILPQWYGEGYGAYVDQFEAGRYVGRQFAIGAGYKNGGLWSTNTGNNTIWVRETCGATSFTIRYIATGISIDAATYVDPAAIEVIKSYIAYKTQLNGNKSGRRVGVEMKFAEYKRQFNLNFGFRRGTSVKRILAGTRRHTALGRLKR